MPLDNLISLETASTLLNVSKQTLRRWEQSGKLNAVRGDNGYRSFEYSQIMSLSPKNKARPFVKWAGGKAKLLPELLKTVPEEFGTYIEPFVGGGALFFACAPKKAILNDNNIELMTTYRVVKENPEDLIDFLESHKKMHSKEYYYETRAKRVEELDDLEIAARFVYLNKTCFNGLFRVNKTGQFNVPIGSYKNPTIVDSENILACSNALENTELYNMDYRKFLKEFPQKDDFIYLDPPYIPISEYSDFDRYSKEKFRINDQVELSTYYKDLVDRGVHAVLSNSSSVFTEKFYSGYQLNKVDASRSINKLGNKRGKIKEYLVTSARQPDSFFPSTRFMGSKKNLLGNIYDAIKDLDVKTVFDAFSGSGAVSYHLKQKGYEIVANDFLSYSAAIAKALIENNSVVLDSADIALLLQKNKNKSDFIEKTFKDIYFLDEDNIFLDNLLANVDLLECDIKRSLALSAISRACLKRRPRGIFTYVGFRYDDGRKDLSYSLREHFLFSVADFNRAVFDNKKKNSSLNKPILEINDLKPDLVYLDPPYFSKHSDNDYVRRYHFIEGLCRNWKGVEIQEETKTKKFKKYESPFNTKAGTYEALDLIFEKYQESKILISYSSNSLPTKDEMVDMLKKYKSSVKTIEIDHRYSFGNQKAAIKSNKVKEYLFLAT